MVLVLMGVSGSGKTTVGKLLAAQLHWEYVEADDYHPAANVEKMRAGVPLTDADRRPWLDTLRLKVDRLCESGTDAVLACSALKHAYQDYLERDEPGCVRYVYLHGTESAIRDRLAARKGHFMNPALLHSQFEALEPPADALWVEVTASPEAAVAEIRAKLELPASGGA